MKNKNLLFLCLVLIPLLIEAQTYRSIDGYGNNPNQPEWGAASGPLQDNLTPAFEDGFSTPARSQNLNPRTISNKLFQQDDLYADHLGLNDFIWAFGQFLDHDLTLVHNYPEEEWMTEGVPIVIPDDDQYMEPGKLIPVMRSKQMGGTGLDINNPRRYINDITAFIDASAVYGSTQERADWLRTFQGGELKTSKGNRLPWNTIDGEFNSTVDVEAPFMEDAVGTSKKLFVAGDQRANENPALLSMHLLFVREHNRLCKAYFESNSNEDPNDPLSDEEAYQYARKRVGAILQNIVYNEWLPALGIHLTDYQGYDPTVNPSITNVFSAAAFRWGHTAINDVLLRFDTEGNISEHGHIELKDAFFNPLEALRLPLEEYVKGMGIQRQQDVDCKVVSALRNFLFEGNPVLGGLDLASINIQRGRERGLPDYNSIREQYGLDRKNAFIEICVDEVQSEVLEETYGTIDAIDPWVGMLAEDHLPNSMFGELVTTIMIQQFEDLRTGDRFFYLNDADLSVEDIEFIETSTLSELIQRNTSIKCFQEEAFIAIPHQDIPCWPYVAPVSLDVAFSPNPVTDYSFLSVYATKEGESHIRLVNAAGQTVYTQTENLKIGENHITIRWDEIYVKGAFYLIVEQGEELTALKALKI